MNCKIPITLPWLMNRHKTVHLDVDGPRDLRNIWKFKVSIGIGFNGIRKRPTLQSDIRPLQYRAAGVAHNSINRDFRTRDRGCGTKKKAEQALLNGPGSRHDVERLVRGVASFRLATVRCDCLVPAGAPLNVARNRTTGIRVAIRKFREANPASQRDRRDAQNHRGASWRGSGNLTLPSQTSLLPRKFPIWILCGTQYMMVLVR